MWRWIGRNLSTLFLAFVLALVVWVSAVLSTDPNVEASYPRPITLQVLGQDESFIQVSEIPSTVRLSLNAPRSIWDQLEVNQDYLQVWIDLSGFGEGTHVVPVKAQVRLTPVQVIKIEPAEIEVTLEPRVTRIFPVHASVTGDPALGYRRGIVHSNPAEVIITGPKSLADRVASISITMDVTGANDTTTKTVPVQPVDQDGNPVAGLTLTPSTVEVTQIVNLLGGYRNVVVKVVTNGHVSEGYWLTNVSVTPPNVTVFSTDPSRVNALPGFVETNPLDLTNLQDDVDIRTTLNLPQGVTLAGEESVLVRLSIAALEGSLPITIPLEVVGLTPELSASLSPDTVDLLLTGAMPLLNNLTAGAIRASVNLTGLEPGVHQVAPIVDLLPTQVSVGSILPESVEVTIVLASEVTPSPMPGTVTPTP